MLRQYNCACNNIGRVLIKHCIQRHLSCDFELTFLKKGAWTCHTCIGGHSIFWPIAAGCIIFFRKVHHWLLSWSHHCLQWLLSQRPLHHCLGKVTGVMHNLVNAVNHISYMVWQVSAVWKSLACTISLSNCLHNWHAHSALEQTAFYHNELPVSTYYT